MWHKLCLTKVIIDDNKYSWPVQIKARIIWYNVIAYLKWVKNKYNNKNHYHNDT